VLFIFFPFEITKKTRHLCVYAPSAKTTNDTTRRTFTLPPPQSASLTHIRPFGDHTPEITRGGPLRHHRRARLILTRKTGAMESTSSPDEAEDDTVAEEAAEETEETLPSPTPTPTQTPTPTPTPPPIAPAPAAPEMMRWEGTHSW